MLSRLVTGLIAVMLSASIGPASTMAQSPGSSDKDSSGRFTGIALITDDTNWHALFQRRETPQVSGRDHFDHGQRGALAILFSNAEPRDGIVKVICDVTAFDPEGSKVVVDSGSCFEGPFAGPNILHPALLDLQFEIGRDDPDGQAGFQITLRDAYSGREVELAVGFTQGLQD